VKPTNVMTDDELKQKFISMASKYMDKKTMGTIDSDDFCAGDPGGHTTVDERCRF